MSLEEKEVWEKWVCLASHEKGLFAPITHVQFASSTATTFSLC